MKREVKKEEIVQYMLSDYQFLEDYQVIDSFKSNMYSFVACIRNCEQKVRFIKRKFNNQQLQRFKTLHKLYKNGIVLCDNLFILQQNDELYFYVIEAEIQAKNPRFQTLHHYLYHSQPSQQERKTLLSKIKILIDCVHQQGQYYAGLDTRKIIIDDQKHIYLAPYDLQFQLKTDNFSRAYYSPELLLKISKLQNQISEQFMEKWDIWAYGCVGLQVIGYSCPYFMSTSLPKQLQAIHGLQVQTILTSQQQTILNLLTNSLCIDDRKRSLSASLSQIQQKKLDNVVNNFKQVENMMQINHQKGKNGMILRQLNIYPSHQSSEKQNFQLTFNILTLNNISFQKQLQISIHLNRAYHIYLDFDEKHPKKYQVNKKITIKAPFDYFLNLLQMPIKVQLKEQDKVSSISVNLKALVLTKQAERVWSQPLIGTYSTINTDGFPQARLKINCALVSLQSNENAINIPLKQNIKSKNLQCLKIAKNKTVKSSIKTQSDKNNQQTSINLVKDVASKLTNKQPILTSKSDKIPSISQIAEQISFITQNFKRKLNKEQPIKQNSLQKKLTSLLKIQTSSDQIIYF